MDAQSYFEVIDTSETGCSVARRSLVDKAASPEKVSLRRVKSRASLAVFARAPQRGKVKTRLARALGDEAALQLYVAMLRDTLAFSRRAMHSERGETVLFFTPPAACDSGFAAREYSRERNFFRGAQRTPLRVALASAKAVREYSRQPTRSRTVAARGAAPRLATRNENTSCEYSYSLRALWDGAALPQSDGDLGKKMRDCCDQLRARGARRVAIIGSDVPDLPPEILAAAFAALESYDLVFGPAQDGGFYLIGASRRFPRALFSGVRWSRADVLSRVLANARRENLRAFLLPEWRDVDDISDWRAFKNRLHARR